MRRTEPFVISDWIVGSPLSDRLDADRAKGFARQLGAWLAAYSGQMDSHGVDAALNWRDYLSKYEIFKENEMRDPELAFLRDLPLKRQIVARNDAAPANWIVTDNGTLCGIDFEAAALKPYGWDVLLAARDLARRFPVAALGLCDALIDGWDHGTESLPKSTFRQLVHLFACRTVSHTTRPCPI
jgi:hypothetical protein